MNLLDELRRSQKSKKNSGLASQEAMDLFILGRDEQAARVAEEFPDHRSNLYVRFLVALGQKQGRELAAPDRETPEAPGIPASYGMDALPMLFLAGTAEDFTALGGGLRYDDRDPRFSAIAAEDGMSRLRYLEGASSETERIETSTAHRNGDGPTAVCHRLEAIGERRPSRSRSRVS